MQWWAALVHYWTVSYLGPTSGQSKLVSTRWDQACGLLQIFTRGSGPYTILLGDWNLNIWLLYTILGYSRSDCAGFYFSRVLV